MLLNLGIAGVHWMILVGLVKLTLVGSLGLIAAGAVVRRLAIRAEQRQAPLLRSESEPVAARSADAEGCEERGCHEGSVSSGREQSTVTLAAVRGREPRATSGELISYSVGERTTQRRRFPPSHGRAQV